MSLENLSILSPKRSINDVSLNITVVIDSVIREAWENTNDVTRFPVEFGTNISDHVIRKPAKYRFSGAITDTPLVNILKGEEISQVTNRFGTSTDSKLTRSQQAWDKLLLIFQNGQPITLQTGLLQLENFVITALNANKDKSTTHALFFEMSCQEIIIVNTDTIQRSSDNLRGKTESQGSDPVNEGQKDKLDLTEQELQSLFQKVRKFGIDSLSELFSRIGGLP